MSREFKVSLVVPELKLYDLKSWIEGQGIRLINVSTMKPIIDEAVRAMKEEKFLQSKKPSKRHLEVHPEYKTKESVLEEYARQRYPNHVTIGEMRATLKAAGFKNLHTTSTTAWNLTSKGVLERIKNARGVYISASKPNSHRSHHKKQYPVSPQNRSLMRFKDIMTSKKILVDCLRGNNHLFINQIREERLPWYNEKYKSVMPSPIEPQSLQPHRLIEEGIIGIDDDGKYFLIKDDPRYQLPELERERTNG